MAGALPMNPALELADGVLLFAHGARDPAWATPFQAVARRCQALQPELQVRLGFLEFMQPDMVTAGAELVALGCRRVRVVPLFLGAGGHVRKDVPALLTQLREAHRQVRFDLAGTIGEHDAVIEAMARVASGVAPA